MEHRLTILDVQIQQKLDEAEEYERENKMFEASLAQSEAQTLIFQKNLLYK